jgi:hypothetical protein
LSNLRQGEGDGVSWSRTRRLDGAEVAGTIAFWRGRLGIGQRVGCERISPFQVTSASGRPGCGLVGVVYDAGAATIYHTRALTAEDIVHELLHVAHPPWTEAMVVAETERLLRGGSRRGGGWGGRPAA